MKKSIFLLFQSIALACSLIVLNSCDSGTESGFDDFDRHNYAPFFVSDDHRSAILDGTIDAGSLSQFRQMMADHPGIGVILFDQAPGSEDDDVNLQIGRLIYDLNLDTHILSNGIVTSGAVDLFLAGYNRSRGTNTLVGVHAWADSTGRQATDYPNNSNVHDFYINYYLSIGLGSFIANEFYFFSINAADANDIYFLNENDINTFQIFTE